MPNPSRPRISAALLREGLEDYEYLYMANGGYPKARSLHSLHISSHECMATLHARAARQSVCCCTQLIAPQVYTKYGVDDTAMSIGFCFHVWNTNPDAYHAIRHELGRKIEGTRADFPYLNAPYVHPYGNYYINFQNASGTNFQPFSFNGTNWIPIGWDGFDVSRGFGWCSQCALIPHWRVRLCVCLMCFSMGMCALTA